jgi:hypothetical protein
MSAAAAGKPSGLGGDASGDRKVGDKNKGRTQPGGTTDKLTTVAGWTQSTWIWGLHLGATKLEKQTAERYVKGEWTIHCRGCGTL